MTFRVKTQTIDIEVKVHALFLTAIGFAALMALGLPVPYVGPF